MKIIFMGTSDFATPALEKLANSEKFEILKVITTPDAVSGRGLKVTYPPVKRSALSIGLPIIQPEKINSEEFLNDIKQLNPDIGIVISFGRILKLPLLTLPKLGCINIHGSLLPKYRGSAPIQWSVINGEKTAGVTSMFMDEGVDTGDIIYQDEIPVLPEDTSQSLHDKLALVGADLLIKTLDSINDGTYPRIKQDDSRASLTRMIKKEDGKIDWENDAEKIINLIRGLTPWPGTFTFAGNKTLKIWSAEIYNNNDAAGSPGEILKIEKKTGFVVSAGKKALLITEVQPENKKRMSAYDYVLGHKIEIGTKLGK